MATTTGTVLTDIAKTIDALTPASQASSGDIFRCGIGYIDTDSGPPKHRQVELIGYGGKRVKECAEYDTQVIINIYYNNTSNAMVNACADADQIIVALQTWVGTNTISVDYIQHDQAAPSPIPGGFVMTRAISVHYRGE